MVTCSDYYCHDPAANFVIRDGSCHSQTAGLYQNVMRCSDVMITSQIGGKGALADIEDISFKNWPFQRIQAPHHLNLDLAPTLRAPQVETETRHQRFPNSKSLEHVQIYTHIVAVEFQMDFLGDAQQEVETCPSRKASGFRWGLMQPLVKIWRDFLTTLHTRPLFGASQSGSDQSTGCPHQTVKKTLFSALEAQKWLGPQKEHCRKKPQERILEAHGPNQQHNPNQMAGIKRTVASTFWQTWDNAYNDVQFITSGFSILCILSCSHLSYLMRSSNNTQQQSCQNQIQS